MTSRRDASRGGSGGYTGQGREETLYHSTRTRVSRVYDRVTGDSVIRKVALGPAALARASNERSILQRIAGISGVAELVATDSDTASDPTVIELTDNGGMPLALTVPEPHRIPALLDLALNLSKILTRIHRLGVIHKEINPTNVIVSEKGAATLIDFDCGSTFPEERPRFAHQNEIAGNLAYLAPEQSGPTGRPVDGRADLYALGATLYAMATGRPPFGDGDPLRLIHDHLTQAPVPPDEINPAVPEGLSRIILRLLEKEPDRRYQSAEGLAYDLSEVIQRRSCGDERPLALAERDFPLRLAPPSRPVGREVEVGRLRAAFEQAAAGRARGVLVTGAPGIGKTALIDEVRPIVTAAGGWFVTGKFDQFRQDARADGVAQVMRALARLLLAEPEERLAVLRTRLREALKPHAGLVVSLLPEFAHLLHVAPDSGAGDDTRADARLVRAGLELLRTVASPSRPLVLAIDDLQWATSTPLSMLDAVLADETLSNVLIVGAHRDGEIGPTHPLSAMMSRLRRLGAMPVTLHLAGLPRDDVAVLLAQMLRLPVHQTADLADAVAGRTGGNPYDTIELVNELRRDSALALNPDGWAWDMSTIRRHVGAGDVVDLLNARIDRLPERSRSQLEVMACVGGEVDVDLLHAATGESVAEVRAHLRPSMEDGLLVMADRDTGNGAVRFRHDRVQQAAHTRMAFETRQALHLRLARRVAALPDYAPAAAQQYLPVVDLVRDPDERRRVAGLFQHEARRVGLINFEATERYLTAAVRLLGPLDTPDPRDAAMHDPMWRTLQAERHLALYRLGRLTEADGVYASAARLFVDPVELAPMICVQLGSLSQRGRHREAMDLGLGLLRRLGLALPGPDFDADVPSRVAALVRWAGRLDLDKDLRRPSVNDPRLLAAERVLSRLAPVAVFIGDTTVVTWIVLESQRMWAEYGPSAGLAANLSGVGVVAARVLDDYRVGYAVGCHMLAVAEARGYEQEISVLRQRHALHLMPWNEPLEHSIDVAQRAREGLLKGGDLQLANHTYMSTLVAQFECAASLDTYAAHIEPALTLATRTGNEHLAPLALVHRELADTLRGSLQVPLPDRPSTGGGAPNFLTTAVSHVYRALAAVLFRDDEALTRHTSEAVALLGFLPGYPKALVYLLRALALANGLNNGREPESALAELDACRDWLASRAADAPSNFLHLLRLVEAERAWAVGDHWSASRAFDEAIEKAAAQQRPWHRALIAEHAGEFYLRSQLSFAGRRLLGDARQLYDTWGASAKVKALDRSYGFLRTAPGRAQEDAGRPAAVVSSDAIDLLAVLRASQALSSETNLDRLRVRVIEVLSALTGATTVRVLLREEEVADWFLTVDSDGVGSRLTVEEAARSGLMALSVFRYVERTGEPLLVADATQDDRFAKDPYVTQSDFCSLLMVPIEVRGTARAMLMLENRLTWGAFSPDRLDTVSLIAGQLAVCLENALVYASLEAKVAERTHTLAAANEQLGRLSITDPLTGLANRRRLARVLDAEWQRSLRTGEPLAVAMIDIDHFKLYNDRYGHPAGDGCLRRVARALLATVRGSDLVARYGGEEFVAVLPGADLATAHDISERARTAVLSLAEPHPMAPLGVVTVSVGIQVLAGPGITSPDQLIHAADAELYEAKRQGRNRVSGTRPHRHPGSS